MKTRPLRYVFSGDYKDQRHPKTFIIECCITNNTNFFCFLPQNGTFSSQDNCPGGNSMKASEYRAQFSFLSDLVLS